jgi:hypothetical protein
MKMQAPRIGTYTEFWPFYLGEHSRAGTRRLHFIGTNLGVAAAVLALIEGRPWFIALGLVLAYGCAWVGHFFVEKNRPATFRYPLWSLVSDFRMLGLMWIGRLDSELARRATTTQG